MHRSTRMTGILIALQAQPRTAQALADRFEVSRRTILRDIEELLQLGVPIEARTGPGGGYAIPRTWWLAPLQLTEDEVQTLLFALDHLGESTDGPWPEPHQGLVEKLRSALNPGALDRALANPARPQVAAHPVAPAPATLATVRSAIAREEWLRVDYRGGSAPGERQVKPLSLHVTGGRWLVHAIDARTAEVRYFRLDRMADARRCLDPQNAARIVAAAMARPDYHAPEHPEVVLRFTERGRLLAMDHPDIRNHLDGDAARFRCPPAELPFYGGELVRFGVEVEVLGPPELRAWLGEHLETLKRHHGNG
jgi:predicted DNA-binding transcriptional regulator YafY